MNAVKLLAENAFASGAELWIVDNSPQSHWWKELDLRSHFLLTDTLKHQPRQLDAGLLEILNETDLKHSTVEFASDYQLVGVAEHFLCRWILLWNKPSAASIDQILDVSLKLHAQSFRFFGSADLAAALVDEISTRPMASSLTISYIENL